MNQNQDQRRRDKAVDIFVIAAWLGILSGLLEAVVLSIFWVMPEWLTWRIRLRNASAEIFWIAPAFDVILFSALASLLLVLLKGKERFGRRFRLLNHLDISRLALLVFIWMGLYAALTLPDRVIRRAALVLALGVAFQAVRWLGPRRDRLISWLRPRTPYSLALVVLLALLIKGGTGLQEQLAVAQLPPAEPGLPNVLLVVVDTLRADHLSSYGYSRPTSPTLDRISREGVLFENAIAPSSWSPPSHASLLLGRRVSEHKVDGMEPLLDTKYPSLAEEMALSGYVTGGFSANLLWVTTRSGFARGFIHYEDYFTNVTDMINRTVFGKEMLNRLVSATGYRNLPGRKAARDINLSLLSWLDNRGKRPFFAFLNYFDAHAPYISPAPFHTRFMTAEQRVEAKGYDFFPEQSKEPPRPKLAEAAYDGAIAYLDAQLDELLKELDARGILDNTILIITSDHGESFGERHLFGHGHSLSLELIRVPLIIRYPGQVPAGVRVASPVGLRAVATTIADLTVGDPVQSVFPTPSLRRHWSKSNAASESRFVVSELQGQPWLPSSVPISKGSQTSIISSGWQILFQNRLTQIYGLKTGPLKELSNTDEGRGVSRDLVPVVKAWRQKNLLH